MIRPLAVVFCCALLLAGTALAEDGDGAVPKTVEGGGHSIKKGGKEIGAGFRGIGRGVKDVFTGKKSKGDFEELERIRLPVPQTSARAWPASAAALVAT